MNEKLDEVMANAAKLLEETKDEIRNGVTCLLELMKEDPSGDFADKFSHFINEMSENGQQYMQSDNEPQQIVGSVASFTSMMASIGYMTCMTEIIHANSCEIKRREAEKAKRAEQEQPAVAEQASEQEEKVEVASGQ